MSLEIKILIVGIYSLAMTAISHLCLVNLPTTWQEGTYFEVANQGYLDPLHLLGDIICPIWLIGIYVSLKILARRTLI
jgi:hypothetical protein